jgi:hypothetical protein
MEIQGAPESNFNSKLAQEKSSQHSEGSDKTPRTAHDINPEKLKKKIAYSQDVGSKPLIGLNDGPHNVLAIKREFLNTQIEHAENLAEKCEHNLTRLGLKLGKVSPRRSSVYQNQKMMLIKKSILNITELNEMRKKLLNKYSNAQSNMKNIQEQIDDYEILLEYCKKVIIEIVHCDKWIQLIELDLNIGVNNAPNSKANYLKSTALLDDEDEKMQSKNAKGGSEAEIKEGQTFMEFLLERLFCGPEDTDADDLLDELKSSRISMALLIITGAWAMNSIW